MGGGTAIEVRNVAKAFRIPTQRKDTLKERVLKPLSRAEFRRLDALRDISFDVGRGEFFGIVGRNGSGKSTLLKLLASIYQADAGTIRVAGNVAPFIELAVGFNLDFTARENVLLNGVMMGLTRSEAERRFDEVMEFAELEAFADLRLKNYSSGMLTRLAFAIMVEVDADVMLIDEVLAVGDASFQQKCFEVFERLRGERTILFVTHDMTAVERFCHRAMLIESGLVRRIGDPSDVARDYMNLNTAVPDTALVDESGYRFTAAWLENAAGERPYSLRHGEEVSFNAMLEVSRPIERPRYCFQVRNSAGSWVYAFPYMNAAPEGDRLRAGDRVQVRATIRNPLAGGQYSLDCTLVTAEREDDVLAHAEQAVAFVVDGPGPSGGLAPFDDEVSSEARSSEVRV